MQGSRQFHTTRWTLVSQSSGDDTASKQALCELCAGYYAPVVAFIARSGFEESRARDLAHDFFARLLTSSQSLKPDRERGRFRSYLLGAVKHFVSDALDRERSRKRGGGAEVLHLTETGQAGPKDEGLTPDRAFDRQWAHTVLERVVQSLAAEFDANGKSATFALIKPWLTGDEGEATQAQTARQLEMNEGALKVAIHRLRKRFRELIRAEIAHTVGDEAEAREELAHLLAAM
jgi:RNA polymerase sigma factor (sigma-70 family)